MSKKPKKPNPIGNKIAAKFTAGMATWRFISLVLLLCLVEIYGNKVGWFHFDSSMLVLNTVLSLWAAVQGSIIMINQNEADKKRDAMLKQILRLEQKIAKGDSHDRR